MGSIQLALLASNDAVALARSRFQTRPARNQDTTATKMNKACLLEQAGRRGNAGLCTHNIIATSARSLVQCWHQGRSVRADRAHCRRIS